MYIPAWQGLHPGHLLPHRHHEPLPFPLNASKATYFYLARNAIYHLFRSLRLGKGDVVLAPAYHSGNEIRAIRAAGAAVQFFSVNRRFEIDLDEVAELARAKVRVLFVIHFLGWPQPMREVQAFCREQGILLVEDCALSMLSELDGRPLGSFGHYAVFCLYKTLPIPNGGLLVQSPTAPQEVGEPRLRPCGLAATAGRSSELMFEWLRSRLDAPGRILFAGKRWAGRLLTAARVKRVPVGDIGFDREQADLGMATVCHRLFKHFDYGDIQRTRRRNYRLLRDALADRATPVREDLADGVCPLFFPLLVPDKHAAAEALQRRGICTVEFWNHGDPAATREAFPDAQFLREHVLELPIHQDITPSHIGYMADTIARLDLRL